MPWIYLGSTCSLWASPGAAPGWVLGRVVPQSGTAAFCLGWLLTPDLEAPEILQEPCPVEGAVDGRLVAPARRQHQSAHPDDQHQDVGVLSLADELILFWGCSEGTRPLGKLGSPGLPSWTTLPRARRPL